MNEWVELCPICGSKLRVDQGFLDHILAEETHDCDNCKLYYYQYAYGSTRCSIMMREFYYHHTQPWTAQQREQERQNRYEGVCRFYWKAGLWRIVMFVRMVDLRIHNFFHGLAYKWRRK